MEEKHIVSDNSLVNHLFSLINPDDWAKLNPQEKRNTIDVLLSSPGDLLTPDMVDAHIEKGAVSDALGPTSSSLSSDAITGLDQTFSDLIRMAEHKMHAYYEGVPAVIARNGMFTIACSIHSEHTGVIVVNRYVIIYDKDGAIFERLGVHKSERSFVDTEVVMQRSDDVQSDVTSMRNNVIEESKEEEMLDDGSTSVHD